MISYSFHGGQAVIDAMEAMFTEVAWNTEPFHGTAVWPGSAVDTSESNRLMWQWSWR